MSQSSILIIRLSAMGDIIHTLPAVTTLKKRFPDHKLVWLVAPRWAPLLEGNPHIDTLIPLDRRDIPRAWHTLQSLRTLQPEMAFDFQGLFQSAILGRLARPKSLFGFAKSVAREPFAALFYSHPVPVEGPHRVERAVQLAQAAGAQKPTFEAWIPAGRLEGELPSGPFVLANPFAGWPGKEWPLEAFDALAQLLNKQGLQLVLNVASHQVKKLQSFEHIHIHTSSLAGLIHATRRAEAVVGVDSGPLHLAAALRKPGVGLYGPTDPALTGPFGGSISVLRTPDVETTYKRHAEIHASMREIRPEVVAAAVLKSIRQPTTASLVAGS